MFGRVKSSILQVDVTDARWLHTYLALPATHHRMQHAARSTPPAPVGLGQPFHTHDARRGRLPFTSPRVILALLISFSVPFGFLSASFTRHS